MTNLPQHILDDIILGEDGFYVYWPKSTGAYTSLHLRWIADKLNEMNDPILKGFHNE